MTCLIQSRFASDTAELVYTAGPDISRIDKFDARNTDTSPRDITVHLVESGGAVGASNLRCFQTIQPEESLELLEIVGHDLNPGDSIWIFASVTDVVSFRVSGRLV